MLISRTHQLMRDIRGAAWANDRDSSRSSPVKLKCCTANAPSRIWSAGPIPPRDSGFGQADADKALTLFTRF
ncbi:hypothetical protein FW320_27590 [Azospirillum sp. Vi22]|nr:hypothetical protein [Azospirillum baldaniorum]